MPQDAITLHALAQELHALLKDRRISKIYQTESDELTIIMRSGEGLLVNVDASLPRIYLTTEKKQAQLHAPSFQMLLRKHIGTGKIMGVELYNKDRIIKITISSYSELRDITHFYLYIELMGRYSNIIFTRADNVILDAIKRISFGSEPTRLIMPTLVYTPPEQNKVAPNDLVALDKAVAVLKEQGTLNTKSLISKISGISKETAKEALFRDKDNIPTLITHFFNIKKSNNYAPSVSVDKEGQALDAFVCPYLSIDKEFRRANSLSEAFSQVYSAKAAMQERQKGARELTKILKKLKDKNIRRIAVAKDKLEECEKMDNYKKLGELLTVNLHKIKSGADSALVYDYYTDKQIEIPLDSAISPQKNAEKYYKRYAKLRRAKEISSNMLSEAMEYSNYLDSIEHAISICSTKEEFCEIKTELAELTPLHKAKRIKKQRPVSKVNMLKFQGYEIYYGKNNNQNEVITFEVASSNDIWLHAKDYPGAHVIIKGGDISQEVLQKGAEVAAYFCSGIGKCEVVWCSKKNVKRAFGGGLGKVNYKDYKSILIDKDTLKNI